MAMHQSRLVRNIWLGIENLLLHKLRSFLTMLGVVFGVGSVVAMLAVGTAGKGRHATSGIACYSAACNRRSAAAVDSAADVVAYYAVGNRWAAAVVSDELRPLSMCFRLLCSW